MEDNYSSFMQMSVYDYCNNPKQWHVLSRIFSRITLKVLCAKKKTNAECILWKTQAQQTTPEWHIDLIKHYINTM